MNSPSSPLQPDSSAIAREDAAITWITEREDGLTPAREQEFSRWLKADPRNATTIARLEQTLGLLRELPDFRTELNTEFGRAAAVVPFPNPGKGAKSTHRRHLLFGLVGAGVAVVLILGLTLFRGSRQPTSIAIYTTTVAGYERALLEDGSTVELNGASTVRVQFTPEERRVELQTGEAHFAVAHDTARPFVVSAGGVFVRAVGTAFNVRFAAQESIEVIVAEGKVRIESTGSGNVSTDGTLVVAGERLVLRPHSPVSAAEKVSAESLRSAMAWQNRLADFADAPLAAVIERFNARSRIQLVLADPELGARSVGGTFALDESEAFARLLTRDGELVAERRGESEILLRRVR